MFEKFDLLPVSTERDEFLFPALLHMWIAKFITTENFKTLSYSVFEKCPGQNDFLKL